MFKLFLNEELVSKLLTKLTDNLSASPLFYNIFRHHLFPMLYFVSRPFLHHLRSSIYNQV